MKRPLLSIIVPTKNRFCYLKYFIKLIDSFDNPEIELVIQDNSDDNSEIIQFLNDSSFKNLNLKYFYESKSLTMTENSELALINSTGEFVCFMGDDDLLSPYVFEFTKMMKDLNIDVASFKGASYYWPGIEHAAHNFPNLVISKGKGQIVNVSQEKEYSKFLKIGATSIEKMPQLYHAIVKKSVLEQMCKVTGEYFPGPSPDMAVAVGLMPFVKRQVYCDLPFISSGQAPKSAGGLGAKHMHKGDLKNKPFLPSNIEEIWDNRIPFVWTGPTIYLQTAIEALNKLGLHDDINKINFNYFYGWYFVFCFDNRIFLKDAINNCDSFNIFKFLYFIFRAFVIRSKAYIKNRLVLNLNYGALLEDGIENIIDAENAIDIYLQQFNFEKMFKGI